MNCYKERMENHINRDKYIEKCNCLEDVLFCLMLLMVMQNEKRHTYYRVYCVAV
jgi:hypothetical protein